MMRITILASLLSLILGTCQAGAAGSSLLVSECIAYNGVCSVVELVQYQLGDGQLRSTQRLGRFKTKQVRFDLGENRIIGNRFLVTHSGDIIDLQSNQLLHDGTGRVLGIDGPEVVQEASGANTRGIFTFSLVTQQYRRLEEPGAWALPGSPAPDRSKSVSVSWWEPGTILLHTPSRRPVRIVSGLTIQVASGSSAFGTVPVLWLDAETLLTQRANGELIGLRIDGSLAPLLTIPIAKAPFLPPDLVYAPNGQILYRCGGEVFSIDIDNRTHERLTWMPLGHGFELELQARPEHGYRIRHHGEVVGEYWCSLATACTAEDHIAVEYGPVGSNLAYPAGVAVRIGESGPWAEIRIDLIDTLIGWFTPPQTPAPG